MSYDIIPQRPESPIIEEWRWETDTIISRNGSEDRIPLLRYPKRIFGGRYQFDNKSDLRNQLATMLSNYGAAIQLPLFQYAVPLKAAVSAGANTVTVNSARSDLRVGQRAFVRGGTTFEVLVVDSISADSVTFTSNLVNSYRKGALVCPLTNAFPSANATISRRNTDSVAFLEYGFTETSLWSPFVDPDNAEELTLFDDLPVLDINSMGTQFDQSILNGMQITDYLNGPDVFDAWSQTKWSAPLKFLCNRVWDLASFKQWFKFLDTVRGSANSFLLPTFREDFEIVTPANGGGSQITLEGSLFSTDYWGLDTYSRIVVDSDAGRHYTKVTAVSSVSGNDRLTFSPALPSGAGWNSNQTVSLLAKVRIVNDKVRCEHLPLQTVIEFTVQTVE